MMFRFAKPLAVVLLSMLDTSSFGVHGGDTSGKRSSDNVDADVIQKDTSNHSTSTELLALKNDIKSHLAKLQVHAHENNHYVRGDSSALASDTNRKHMKHMKKAIGMMHVGTGRNDRILQGDCDREAEDVVDCGISERCLDCIIEASESRTSFEPGCDDFEDHFCEEYSRCERSCGSCMDEIFELADCLVDSDRNFGRCSLLDCPDSGSSDGDSDGDGRGSGGSCDSLEREVLGCNPSNSCFGCIAAAIESRSSFSSCSDIEDHHCDEFERCERSCGFCIDEILEHVACLVNEVDFFSNCQLYDCTWV